MKKSIVAFLILCIMGLTLIGCSPQASAEPITKVVYEVTGTATAVDITIATPQGGTEQYINVGLPSKFTYKGFPGYFLYVSTQNRGESGSVTVTIYVNDIVYKRSTSQGAYAIAEASGAKPSGVIKKP